MSQPPMRAMTPPPTYHDLPQSTLRPYLTLPYLLSLSWLAYPILSLLFVIFRLQISSSSAQDAVNDARGNLLLSCQAAQQAAQSAASLPRFMAVGTNRQFADAVNATMNGSREALILVLTCMEAIINFLIDIYRSTFLCFLELAIRGGLSILIEGVKLVSDGIQTTANALRTVIQDDISGFNKVVQTTVDGLNKLIPFGDPIKAPQLDVPDLTSLQNVTLPSSIEDALSKLNSSIPSLDTLRNSIQGLIDTPFELVKKDINDTFANLTFDGSLLPLPPQNTLSFCSDMDTSIVDDLGKDLLKVARIGTGILLIILVLFLAGSWALEWWKWRSLKKNMERTRSAWMSDPTVYNPSGAHGVGVGAPVMQMSDHNLLTLHSTSQHPLLSRLANKLSAMFNLTPSQYSNLQFFFHYVFHAPALACFLIGFFGLISVQLQLLAIKPIEAKFQDQTSAAVTDFSNTIATSVNASMYNQSSFYADGINSRVAAMQNTIDNGVFGWVNGTTTTLNNTLVSFYNDVQNVVDQIFGGTILEQPAQTFVQCIIGSKVESLEKALTFLHDNLHVSLPTVNETLLVLSPDEVNQVSQPISAAAVGGGSDDQDGGLVGKLVGRYIESLKVERIMFSIFIGLWLLVVIIACGIIMWHSYVRPVLDKRQKRKFNTENEKNLNEWATYSNTPPQVPRSKSEESFAPVIDAENGGFWNGFKNQIGTAQPNSTSPKMEKSTLFDGRIKKSFRRSRKLKLQGRKSMGREVFMTDEEARAARLEEEEQNNWLGRVKNMGKKRQDRASIITPFALPPSSSGSSTPMRSKPNLTITTDGLGSRNLPEIETTVPGSAWSVSPNSSGPRPPVRKLPWLHNMNVAHRRPEPVPPQGNYGQSLTPVQINPDAPLPISAPESPMFIPPRGLSVPPQPRVGEHHFSFTPISETRLGHGSMTPVTFLFHATTSGREKNPFSDPANTIPPVPSHDPFTTPFDDPTSPSHVPQTPKAV